MDVSQAEDIGSVLFRQRNPDNGADISFIVAGEEIWAHSIVVTKRSEVLAALFGGEFVEGQRRFAVIEDSSAESFVSFLNLLYTRKFDVNVPCGAVVLAAFGAREAHRQRRCFRRVSNISLHDTVSQSDLPRSHGHMVHTDEEGGMWLVFASTLKATSFSSQIMQMLQTPNANVTEPQRQDVIGSIDVIARVLDVIKLLDKYNVEGFASCIVEQLDRLLMWGKALHSVVEACFGLLEGSEYHSTLWNICQTYACRNDEQAVVHFKAGHAVLPIRDAESSVFLRASLQILRWQLDWVFANETSLGGATSSVKRHITCAMQEVLNTWAKLPVQSAAKSQSHKRARIEH